MRDKFWYWIEIIVYGSIFIFFLVIPMIPYTRANNPLDLDTWSFLGDDLSCNEENLKAFLNRENKKSVCKASPIALLLLHERDAEYYGQNYSTASFANELGGRCYLSGVWEIFCNKFKANMGTMNND